MSDVSFPVQTWPAGAVLFGPGQPPAAMYLIESGEVDLALPGRPARRLRSGDVFGEQAIFGGEDPGASAQAVSDLVCTVVDVATLQSVLRSQKSMTRPVIEAVMLQMYLHNAMQAGQAAA